MSLSPRPLAAWLWIGLAVSIAGRALDLRWHATHDEFETISDQTQAHWLAWLGALVLLVIAALGTAQGHSSVAMFAILIGAGGYALVAVWHFYEHSQLRDPDLPHVLLALTQLVMLVGAPVAAWTLRSRGGSRPGIGA